MQEDKQAQNESQCNLEAIKAQEQLYRIENRIKLRQEFYHSKILETASKAKKRIEASMDGYDKHHLIQEQDAEKRTLHIMKKNELIEKKQKMAKKEYKNKASVLNDSMKAKFENVAKAKINSKAEYHERLREIHDRRSLKEEKKEKVLKSVDLNH